jgi:aminocarboxymuconate-semialdehyde decarboxylase
LIVDMHAHVVPRHFPPAGHRVSSARWPVMEHVGSDQARVMIGGSNFRTIHSGNWDPERRLRDMDQHGITAQVISPMPELLSYWFAPQDALDFGQHVNDSILHMCQAAPERLFGLGMVPLQDPDRAAKALASVKSAGLHGVELGSNVNGRYLGAPDFLPFFQEVERLGLCVFVHALHPTVVEHLPSHSLGNPIGFPIDTCLSIVSLMASGTAQRCPNLRIAFSHGGGVFPFLLPRYHNRWSGTWNEEPRTEAARAAVDEPASPFELARRFYFDTLVFDRRALRYLIDTMGHRQLLVGTDYPYFTPEQPTDRTLQSLGLPHHFSEDITWNNCWRFLGIPTPVEKRPVR